MNEPEVRELRVVPMVIDDDLEPLPEDVPLTPEAQPPARRKVWWPGLLPVVLALAAAVVQIVATIGAAADPVGSTTLAWVAIVLASAALVGGLTLAFLGFGRRWALLGALLAIPANPFLLLHLLTALSGT